MDVIHFPDDPRPPRWSQPVLALGNFDGVHRGHRKILDRVQPRRQRARRDLRRHDLRSAPAARRPARQGAAAADDQGAEARGARATPACRARRSSASRRSCRAGIRRRSCGPCWSTGCASSEVWVGANFLFGHDRAGNFSLLRALGARYGFRAEKIDPVRYKDFVVSSTRIRRLVSEGRVDEAGALLGHQYFIDGTVVHGDAARPRRSASRPPTCAPRTSCCRRTASTRRPRRSTASCTPSVTNIGVRPTVDDVRTRPSSRRTSSTSTRDLYGAPIRRRVRAAAARRAGVRRRSTLLRAQIDADCRRARVLFGRLSL